MDSAQERQHFFKSLQDIGQTQMESPKARHRQRDDMRRTPTQQPTQTDIDEYIHENLSRQDAEALLNYMGGDGTFLMRKSTTKAGHFVLSMMQNGAPVHRFFLVGIKSSIKMNENLSVQ